ncbi:MAG: 1-deoxy-D-xylulose-5-phosphate reductoisomerase [Bacteroidales bacterium]
MNKKRIAVIGSTGSIGTQTLEVISEQNEFFEVEVLSAHNNADLLIQQALKYKPNAVVIGNEQLYTQVFEALNPYDIKVFTGEKSLEDIVEFDSIDMVVTALMGSAGLKPTLNALRHKKPIALANKETLVMAGELVSKTAAENGCNIYPIDSEHSAIFQCLAGEFDNPIEKIILTGSGGPFRGKSMEELAHVTKAQALKHPTWQMGAKITIDSASLMNKGMEVIEAKWLFGLKPEQIEVLIHPQSVIHSMVQFQDGALKAQMGLPDMKLPIQYALSYPQRLKTSFPRLDWRMYPQFTFEKPQMDTFKNLALAFEALHRGGNTCCVLNGANEVAVQAFLKDQIGFVQMSQIIEKCMAKVNFIAQPTLSDLLASDQEARLYANEYIKN